MCLQNSRAGIPGEKKEHVNVILKPLESILRRAVAIWEGMLYVSLQDLIWTRAQFGQRKISPPVIYRILAELRFTASARTTSRSLFCPRTMKGQARKTLSWGKNLTWRIPYTLHQKDQSLPVSCRKPLICCHSTASTHAAHQLEAATPPAT